MLDLLRFLRRIAVPAVTCAVLNGMFFLLTQQYGTLLPLREPLEVLAPGLAGVWAARSRMARSWQIELLAGATAGLLVGGVRLLLGHGVVGLPLQTEALHLGRAVLAGGIGAMVSRLLHQRVVL